MPRINDCESNPDCTLIGTEYDEAGNLYWVYLCSGGRSVYPDTPAPPEE